MLWFFHDSYPRVEFFGHYFRFILDSWKDSTNIITFKKFFILASWLFSWRYLEKYGVYEINWSISGFLNSSKPTLDSPTNEILLPIIKQSVFFRTLNKNLTTYNLTITNSAIMYLKISWWRDWWAAFGLSITSRGRYFLHLCCSCFNFPKFISHRWSVAITAVCLWRYRWRGSWWCPWWSTRVVMSSLDTSINRWRHKWAKGIFLPHCDIDSRC